MGEFITLRAGRQSDYYIENLIKNMHNAEGMIFRQGYGLFATDSFSIIASFQAAQNTYQKPNRVKAHYMEIRIEREHDQSDVCRVADDMGRYLFGMGYQTLVLVTAMRAYYVISIVVNATSYCSEIPKFHDNNTNYLNLYKHLCYIAPADWEVKVADALFFAPKHGEGNYVHGRYA